MMAVQFGRVYKKELNYTFFFFVDAEGGWNGTRMMQYLITATDEKGKSDTVSVFVIFRDSFMLN